MVYNIVSGPILVSDSGKIRKSFAQVDQNCFNSGVILSVWGGTENCDVLDL